MSVIWMRIEDEELYLRSQSFCIHSSSVQLTAGIAASFWTPPSRVWTSGGLMELSDRQRLSWQGELRQRNFSASTEIH